MSRGLKQNSNRWIHTASNGGILVSAFISRREKEVREMAEVMGGKIVLIVQEAFPERYKPSDHDFALCTAGRMLIVSLGLPRGTALSRSVCLQMNALAQTICTL